MPVLTLLITAIILLACGSPARAQGAADNAIRLLVEQARQKPDLRIRGARLLQPAAVAKFFETRGFTPVWLIPKGTNELLKAIRAIEDDGLTPDDYHLAVLTATLDAHTKTATPETAAELQVLMADAAAALIDHVRFGRVRPASLDKRWNVDPRVGARAARRHARSARPSRRRSTAASTRSSPITSSTPASSRRTRACAASPGPVDGRRCRRARRSSRA